MELMWTVCYRVQTKSRTARCSSIIQTVDTDAVVLIDIFADRLGCEYLIVAIGTGISFRYVDATGR